MKFFSLKHSLTALLLGVCVLAPSTSMAARKHTIYRDLDGDGHFNKETFDHGRSHYRGGHGYYGGRSYYGGRGYYGRPSYGYGYSRPYYYNDYYYRPSLGLSFYSSPSYYSTPAYYSSPEYYSSETRVYRGRTAESSDDNLAVEVQRALKRRGYYGGSIDGQIGAGSRSAIRAYQADRGLSVTGRIDRSLLGALGIG